MESPDHFDQFAQQCAVERFAIVEGEYHVVSRMGLHIIIEKLKVIVQPPPALFARQTKQYDNSRMGRPVHGYAGHPLRLDQSLLRNC